MIVPPGESKSGVIEVENASEVTLSVKAYLQDWAYTPAQDGSKNFYPPKATPASCADWVKVSLSDFVIPAYSSQRINYTIQVPSDAKGAYYAVLFFESNISQFDLKNPAGMGVQVRIGALFFIEPEGTVTRVAELSDFSARRSSSGDALEVAMNFKNTGNADITTAGEFNIIDQEGMVYARGAFNDVYTLPGDQAKVSASWKEALEPGNYDMILTFDLGRVLTEAGIGSGPVLTFEAPVSIGSGGEVVSVGELK